MVKRIDYKAGDFVGDHGLIFIEDAEPYVAPNGTNVRKGRFLCACNQSFEACLKHVNNGNTKSCGCYKNVISSDNPNWRGGVKSHYLYNTWNGIKKRCFSESSENYRHYGGRGITMHEPWVNDPKSFLDWMDENLGPRPEGFSIDRIDNDGHYAPGNLRWADQSTQVKNQRRNLK